MKIAVIGSGSWGTALAQTLTDNGHDVLIYGVVPDEVEDINIRHINSRYFEDLTISDKLHATLNPDEIAGYTDAFLLAVPTRFFGDVLQMLAKYTDKRTVIINVAKGFSWDTDERLSVYIRRRLADAPYAGIVSVIGPSHAEEVIRRMLTLVCAVSTDESLAKCVQQMFSNQYLRVYTLGDETGAEYGVALKNVIAIASGILEGQGFGDNAKAALITRGLREMIRYGVAKGGRKETFTGLTGVGDLIVTCFSPHSRNYRAGLEIGRANSADTLKCNKTTVEGVHSCLSIYRDAQEMGLEMPIVEAMYATLYEDKEPREQITRLMQRPLKEEF